MSRIVLPSKLAGATVRRRISFLSDLAPGDTLSAPSATASTYSGTDANPNLLSGSPSIDGSDVIIALTGGVAGVTYSIVVQAASGSQVLQRTAYLTVVPSHA